jgi:PAS domain S-box-containing protein
VLEAAAAADDKFRGLLESAPDPIVIVDQQGLIRIVNRQVESVFGYTREELLDRSVELLLPERFRGAHSGHRDAYMHKPRTRPMGIGLELFGQRKDGTEFPVEISLSPMHSGDELLVTGIIRDLTGRKQVEERLRETAAELARSNAELEQFAYVASHDLQEPLRMVASYTQLLARRYKGRLDEDADEFINFAVDGALRMQELINDLLTYSRVGSRALEVTQIRLGDTLDRVISDLGGAIADSHATVTRDEQLPTIDGDATQLQQLFQNLIANGIKFRRQEVDPVVHIAARNETAGRCVLTVSDNGIGIEQQYLDRIFVLFQRLHSRAEYPGTGIGLAICRRIVERHGGTIAVSSTPGQGTRFEITLPERQPR